MTSRSKGGTLHAALVHTSRLLKARKGPATAADRPTRKGRKPRALRGQLDIFGREHGEP